jgi:hypothetical protein
MDLQNKKSGVAGVAGVQEFRSSGVQEFRSSGDSLNGFWERILASQVKLRSQNSSKKMSVLVFCNF